MTRGRSADAGSPPWRIAEERQHLVAHDANDLLLGRQAAQHFLVDGAIAHAIDEGLDDLEVDVRFEQRHANFAQRQLDRLFGQSSLAANRAEDVLQAVGERVKHDGIGALSYSDANVYRSGMGKNVNHWGSGFAVRPRPRPKTAFHL